MIISQNYLTPMDTMRLNAAREKSPIRGGLSVLPTIARYNSMVQINPTSDSNPTLFGAPINTPIRESIAFRHHRTFGFKSRPNR